MSTATLIERSVFDYLLTRQEATVAQVADHLDLPVSTAVNVLARLAQRGAVARTAPVIQGRGRPLLPYRVQLPGPVATILFDGSLLAGAIINPQLGCLAERVIDLVRVDGRAQAIQLAEQLLATLLATANIRRDDLAYVALGLNAMRVGPRTLTSSVLPWASGELPAALARKLRVPVKLVSWSEIAAEFHHLPDPVPQSLLYLRVGDGVSCRAMIFGRIPPGHNHLAGELGHVTLDPGDPQAPRCGCGRSGCLEAYASGPAICRALAGGLKRGVKSRLDPHLLRAGATRPAIEHIWRAWEQGDAYTRRTMAPIFDRLAWGLSMPINIIDPDLVRVGGYVLRDRQAWIDELSKRLRPYLFNGSKRKLILESGRARLEDQQRVAALCVLELQP